MPEARPHSPSDCRRLSRRDVLKRGAVAGSAGVWLAPAIQVIGMGAASAQLASQPARLNASSTTSTSTSTTTTTAVPVASQPTIASAPTGAPKASSTTTTTVAVRTELPSQVDLIVTNSTGNKFGVRFNGPTAPAWTTIPAGAAGCAASYAAGYTTDPQIVAALNASAPVLTTLDRDGRATYTIKLPPGVTLVAGWAKCGQKCLPAIAVGSNSYDFHC